MTNIRIEEEDRERLKEMKQLPQVREMAAERGLIEDETRMLRYDQLLQMIIPDDADEVERKMVWFDPRSEADTIRELCGKNVANHEVVKKFTDEFQDEYNIELDNE